MIKNDRKDKVSSGGFDLGIGGILKGLGDMVEKLNQLSENGQELSQTGEIREGDRTKAIYGFTMRVGLGDQGPRIEPFGNIGKDVKTGRTVVQETREPVVDVFEEGDHVLVVAEMPGITAADVTLEVQDNLLTLAAAKGGKKYRKEIELPQNFSKEKMQLSCNNGVVEIKCVR